MDLTLDVNLTPDQSAALAAEADTRQRTIADLLQERLSDVLAIDVRTYRERRGEPHPDDARVDELRAQLDAARRDAQDLRTELKQAVDGKLLELHTENDKLKGELETLRTARQTTPAAPPSDPPPAAPHDTPEMAAERAQA